VIDGQNTHKTLLRGLRINDALSGALDPKLELVRIYPGNPVAEFLERNDNWRDHGRAGEIAALASNLVPPDNRDAAILRDFVPGVYTVLMQPANSATGVGIVGVDALN